MDRKVSTGTSCIFVDGTKFSTGFFLGYYDGTYSYWNSYDSTGQSGSKMTITYISPYNENTKQYIVEGTFNCTVYDGYGGSIKIKNGKFRAPFGL